MNSDGGTYRAVQDTFWTDIMILDLQPDEKLFYIWLFTNPHLDTCGCYQVSLKTIEYETALSRERISELIQLFIDNGRIKYDVINKEIILLKWKKNNSGFFNPKNANSLKAIKLGAAKIKTPEFREIVGGWLGAALAAEPETPLAPTLPPMEAPTQGGRTQPITETRTNNQEPKSKSSSSSPPEEMPPQTREETPQTAMRMTTTDFRFLWHQTFGTIMPGGCAEKAGRLCLEFLAPAIREAFQAAAVHGKPTLAYVEGVLRGNGTGKGSLARASPSGPVSFEKAKSNRTKQAVQEFVERRKRAECQETTSSSGPSSTGSPRPLGWNAPPSG